MEDFLEYKVLNLNNTKFIYLIEKFVSAKIEYYITLYLKENSLHSDNNIAKNIEYLIARDLTVYLVKIIKCNSNLFTEDYSINIVNTAEQITSKLIPIITLQVERHLNYLHSYSLQNNFLEATI